MKRRSRPEAAPTAVGWQARTDTESTRRPVPYDATLEGDVLAGVARGDLRDGLPHLTGEHFYVVAHQRLLAALQRLHRRGRLVYEIETRVAGQAVPLAGALGHPSVEIAATVRGIEEALAEVGSPDPRSDRRRLEQILRTAPTATAAALHRLDALAHVRRRLYELERERAALLEEVAS